MWHNLLTKGNTIHRWYLPLFQYRTLLVPVTKLGVSWSIEVSDISNMTDRWGPKFGDQMSFSNTRGFMSLQYTCLVKYLPFPSFSFVFISGVISSFTSPETRLQYHGRVPSVPTFHYRRKEDDDVYPKGVSKSLGGDPTVTPWHWGPDCHTVTLDCRSRMVHLIVTTDSVRSSLRILRLVKSVSVQLFQTGGPLSSSTKYLLLSRSRVSMW